MTLPLLPNKYNRHFLKGSYKERTDEIIEGRRVLNMCEDKLKDFTFMNDKDFESPNLRKFLLVFRTMCLTSWKMNVLDSEKDILKEYDAEDEFEDKLEDDFEEDDFEKEFEDDKFEEEFEDEYEHGSGESEEDDNVPILSIFNDFDEDENMEKDISYDYGDADFADFESNDDYDDLSSMSGEEFFEDDTTFYDDDCEIKDVNSITADLCKVLNNGFECPPRIRDSDDSDEYDEKENIREVDFLQEKDFNRVSSVVTLVRDQIGKRSLNPDEEISSTTYKKVKII